MLGGGGVRFPWGFCETGGGEIPPYSKRGGYPPGTGQKYFHKEHEFFEALRADIRQYTKEYIVIWIKLSPFLTMCNFFWYSCVAENSKNMWLTCIRNSGEDRNVIFLTLLSS